VARVQSNLAKAAVAVIAGGAIVALFLVLSEDETATDQELPPLADTEDEIDRVEPDSPLEGGPGTPRTGPPTIRVVDGEPRGGIAELNYRAGDRIRFIVRSDTPDEIHVHGYDVYADVGPGEPAELDFRAELDGVYEAELHDSGAQIAQLTIRP
jgi:hypothetical protein